MSKTAKKLSLKALVILIIIGVAVVTIAIVMTVAACLGDADRLIYEENADGTYCVSDVKDTYRGGIFAKDTITVPAEYKGQPVTLIKKLDLHGTKHVIVSEGIEQIGLSAFYKTTVETVQLPSTIKIIGSTAFTGCAYLTTINLPDSITSIGSSAFKDCVSLEHITLPKNITSIQNNLFSGCTKLQNLTIPEKVTQIGSYAFWSCECLTEMTIPQKVTSIGDHAFENCKALTKITLSDTNWQVGQPPKNPNDHPEQTDISEQLTSPQKIAELLTQGNYCALLWSHYDNTEEQPTT